VHILSTFVAFPWLALFPALIFAVLGYRSRRMLPWVVAVAWLLYTAYETAMARRILCSGDCNIRVDLLLLYPVLAAISVAAAIAAGKRWRSAAVANE
jgi:hypothetical protein